MLLRKTGTNSVPLGRKRRIGGGEDDAEEEGSNLQVATVGSGFTNISGTLVSRGRQPTRQRHPKLYRWNNDKETNSIAALVGLETSLTGIFTTEQIEAYVANFRIEEITQKLRTNDVIPDEKDRSPSPPPQYDTQGIRTNTRDIRYRNKLEKERHELVEKSMLCIPLYKPPTNYKRQQKTQEKIYIPRNDYPEVNFVGLLLGPRGKTLKEMETKSGAKIAIRGKGSVKEGKGSRTDIPFQESMDDELHCIVTADTEDKIQIAVDLINQIVATAASTPEYENSHKREQLRALAALNGTLRDFSQQPCSNCGELGHQRYECPNQKSITSSIVCRNCGGVGHFARDCKEKKGRASSAPKSAADQEYEQLMAELGGNIRPSSGSNSTPIKTITNGGDNGNGFPANAPRGPSNSNSRPDRERSRRDRDRDRERERGGDYNRRERDYVREESRSDDYPAEPRNQNVHIPFTPPSGMSSIPGIPFVPGSIPGLPPIPPKPTPSSASQPSLGIPGISGPPGISAPPGLGGPPGFGTPPPAPGLNPLPPPPPGSNRPPPPPPPGHSSNRLPPPPPPPGR